MPRSVSGPRIANLGLTFMTSYVLAIVARDAVYWPIVVKIYSEVNRIDTNLAYECKQALNMLKLMKLEREMGVIGQA